MRSSASIFVSFLESDMPEIPRAPPLNEELSVRLGRIIVRWTILESWLAAMLGTFLEADQGAFMIVASKLSLSAQIKCVQGLLANDNGDPASIKRALDLLSRADEIRSERNEIVHGVWDETKCDPGTALIQTINLDRKEVIRSRLITKHDLDELLIEINDWVDDFVSTGRDLGFPRKKGGTKSIFSD